MSGQTQNPFASAWQPTGTSQTVSHAQAERQKRQEERDRLNASRRIQKTWRSYRVRENIRESRRRAFDDVFEDSIGSQRDRVDTALPLLLASFQSTNARDRQRLDRLANDIYPQEVERLVTSADQRTPYRLNRLATILVAALEAGGAAQHVHLLELLTKLAKLAPQCLSTILARYYTLLAISATTLPASSILVETVQQAAAAPLGAWPESCPDSRVTDAYSAFATKFLSKQGLALNIKESDVIAQNADLDKLAVAIIDAHAFQNPQDWTADAQLWLLANFIDLHQARPKPSQRNSYLRALQLQLDTLADHIRLRYPNKTDNPKLTSQASTGSSQLLPEYVRRKISSLIDREGITALLAELTSHASNVEGASLLAGYIITLIRCFPEQSDDIRMRLFLGDVSSGTGQTVPVVKFLWGSTRQTRVYQQVEEDKSSAAASLVRSYLSKTIGAESTENKEWRLVLLFLELYTFILRLSDDDDFFSTVHPNLITETQGSSRIRSCGLSMGEIKSLTTFLKNLAFTLIHDGPGILESLRPVDLSGGVKLDTYFGQAPARGSTDGQNVEGSRPFPSNLDLEALRTTITTALRMLYERDSRRPFLPANHWLMTSKFDMGRFVDAVVIEQQRQQEELTAKEAEEEDGVEDEEDGDVIMGGAYDHPHTAAGQRLSRHAQIERLRSQQRKAQRDRMLSVIGPKLEVLKHMPFAIPFSTRVEIFRKFIDADKMRRRNGLDAETWRISMINNPLMPTSRLHARHHATITRSREFDDAYEQFYELGDGLKEPIQIQFVDKFGETEAGIDGGGVTKEFLISAIDNAFSSTTEDYFVANKQGLIYPNPIVLDRLRDLLRHATSSEVQESTADLLRRYEFLGRIVGKCLYESILVDISFAGFFLLKWATGQAGENSYRGNLNDLRDMDEELYQGMLKLKNYSGDSAELGLDFTIEDQISGRDEPVKTITRQLIPHGDDVAVTNDNRLLYISYVARHRLIAQPQAQTTAFLRGLRSMIAPSWLSMFNQNELQRLVGGDSSEIDVDDLRRNTVYSGLYDPGYSKDDHSTIQLFWKVVKGFSDAQRRLLLKYVTSTPRAPLLGFSQLNPRFSIRDSGTDEERLPSTSTCVNLLKLPRYTDEATLRKKLLQAIESGAGFDLS